MFVTSVFKIYMIIYINISTYAIKEHLIYEFKISY